MSGKVDIDVGALSGLDLARYRFNIQVPPEKSRDSEARECFGIPEQHRWICSQQPPRHLYIVPRPKPATANVPGEGTVVTPSSRGQDDISTREADGSCVAPKHNSRSAAPRRTRRSGRKCGEWRRLLGGVASLEIVSS